MVTPSSACSSLATPARPCVCCAPTPSASETLQCLRRKHDQLTHSSFSSNHAQPHTHTSKPRPTSQHTPRLLHHPRSTHFQLPLPLHTCKHTITSCRCYESHHRHSPNLVSLSPPRQCTPPFHRRQVVSAIVSLLQPCHTCPSLCLLRSNAIRLRDRSSACEVTTHNLTHSSFSSNQRTTSYTHLRNHVAPPLNTHPDCSITLGHTHFRLPLPLTHMQTHNHIMSLL